MRASQAFPLLACVLLSACATKPGDAGPIKKAAAAPARVKLPPAASTPRSSAGARRPSPPPLIEGCPAEMARAGSACVDRYEADLQVIGASGVGPHSPYERPERGQRYRARSQKGVVPQAYVNRVEAAAACGEAGKRLCTLAEWYGACRGSGRTTYPYGASYQKDSCNSGKVHLLSKLYGTDNRRWTYDDHFNNPELNKTPDFLARSAAYSGCKSSFGVYDMVGNLHEWVSDSVDATLEQKLPLRDDIRVKLGVNHNHGIFMGGFYSTTFEHGEGCGFVTIGHGPTYHDYSTGFRCCKDPQGD